MQFIRTWVLAACLMGLSQSLIPVVAHAASVVNGKREKVLDFEDEVVEGVNKRPFDSLSQVSESDKRRRRPHLYRKRAGFRVETAETLQDLRFLP